MMKVYQTQFTPSQCRALLKQDITRFRSVFLLGSEQFTGWTLGNWFAVAYHDGEDSGTKLDQYGITRGIRLIRNKALAHMRVKNGVTHIGVRAHRGATDTPSIVFWLCVMFVLSMGIGLLSSGADWETALLVSAVAAPTITLIHVLMTLAWSYLSPAGEENEKRLLNFLENSLQLKLVNSGQSIFE